MTRPQAGQGYAPVSQMSGDGRRDLPGRAVIARQTSTDRPRVRENGAGRESGSGAPRTGGGPAPSNGPAPSGVKPKPAPSGAFSAPVITEANKSGGSPSAEQARQSRGGVIRRRPAARGPRRARLQLRHVNPWTVLKFSCVLSVALFFIWMITIGALYFVLNGTGIIGTINDTIVKINGDGSKAPVTPSIVFGGAAIIGVVNVVLFIALSTIGSVMYNLCADLVGGVEVTLAERDS
ncbi:MAG: DUF3566 domain-containing protein [Actinomycetia bacterium]|nr:DUF3566 domain-containing protein [Actinomycetes bacterium]